MKITGGIGRGLPIETPTGDRTRPSTDRMRESVFAILRDLLPGARVLDLFAGSGSLGLEAASRGAEEVHWVEQHAPTAALIRKNAARLPPAGVSCMFRVHAADVLSWLRKTELPPFDIVFADPPYETLQTPEHFAALLQAISSRPRISPEGLLVLECSGRFRADPPPGWSLLRRESYGSSAVLFLDANITAASPG